MMRRCLPALILLLCLPGCVWGPGIGLDGFAAQGRRKVSMQTVENRLFPHRPGLEYELTQRLKEEIATDRRLVLSEGGADVRLKVSLIRFSEPNLVEDLSTGEPAEILLKATAQVEANGDDFTRKRKVTVSTSYAPGLGDSRREGLDRLWRDLAREILDVAADEEWSSP